VLGVRSFFIISGSADSDNILPIDFRRAIKSAILAQGAIKNRFRRGAFGHPAGQIPSRA